MQRPVQQTAATVIEWLEEGRRVVAGTLVGVDGSAPLDVGASVYIDEHGVIEGSVTGGCVESAVAQEALDMLEQGLPPKLVTYGISDELAGTVGLMCGGIVHIFIHPIHADARDATLAGLAASRDAGGPRREPGRAPGRARHADRRRPRGREALRRSRRVDRDARRHGAAGL